VAQRNAMTKNYAIAYASACLQVSVTQLLYMSLTDDHTCGHVLAKQPFHMIGEKYVIRTGDEQHEDAGRWANGGARLHIAIHISGQPELHPCDRDVCTPPCCGCRPHIHHINTHPGKKQRSAIRQTSTRAYFVHKRALAGDNGRCWYNLRHKCSKLSSQPKQMRPASPAPHPKPGLAC